MLQQLTGHITNEQLEGIVNIIISQYAKYNSLLNSDKFKSVFSNEYAPHNRQFSISWAIASGFPSNSDVCDGMNISCYKYSRKFTRPLLWNHNTHIMVLNKTTHFSADYLNEFYKMNENSQELFCYIKFSVDNKRLTRISICVPDIHGTVVAEEVLLDKSQIFLRIAA